MIRLGTLIVLALLGSSAHANEPGAWRLDSAFQIRNNQLGLGLLTYSGYRVPLYDSTHMLLKPAYVEAGVVTQLSPASLHPGVYAEIVPIAPLRFRLSASRLGYFGLFGTVVEYPSADADWSPEALKDHEPNAKGSVGTRWEAMGQLRIKVGSILALHEQRLQGVRVDTVTRGAYWYESINDLLVARRDRIHIHKTTLAYKITGVLKEEFLVAGLHFESYEALKAGSKRQIAGVVGLWRPNAKWWGSPIFNGLVGFMPEDNFRKNSVYIGGQAKVLFSGE